MSEGWDRCTLGAWDRRGMKTLRVPPNLVRFPRHFLRLQVSSNGVSSVIVYISAVPGRRHWWTKSKFWLPSITPVLFELVFSVLTSSTLRSNGFCAAIMPRVPILFVRIWTAAVVVLNGRDLASFLTASQRAFWNIVVPLAVDRRCIFLALRRNELIILQYDFQTDATTGENPWRILKMEDPPLPTTLQRKNSEKSVLYQDYKVSPAI